jgi:hypothetical protein
MCESAGVRPVRGGRSVFEDCEEKAKVLTGDEAVGADKCASGVFKCVVLAHGEIAKKRRS